jgi:hypothetical protein
MAASGIHRRSATPTNLAASGKQEYDTQSEARKHVGQWVESASSHSNPEHTPEVNEARKAQFNAFGHVVSQQLIPQITTGATHLVLDAPENRNNRAFLNTLRLPHPYTLEIKEAPPDVAESPDASSPEARPSPDLDPFSWQRPFAPQGGVVNMPLQELSKAQEESLEPLVEAFVKSVKTNTDKARAPVLVEALLTQVANLAASSNGDLESFRFGLAVQVAAKAKVVGDEPLRQLVRRLPEDWHHLFEQGAENKDALQDYRPLMAFVERGTKPAAPARAPVMRAQLPLVPFKLEEAVNAYVAYFNSSDEGARALGARAIIKQIGEVAGKPGQPEKTDMTIAVGNRFRQACARRKDDKPLISFASHLKGDSQAFFLEVLMSDDQFKNAQRTVAKLAADRVPMSDAQFSKFQLKYGGIVSIIGKLPYQTRMMVANDLNKEIERIASVNEDRGGAIRNLKLVVTDLD